MDALSSPAKGTVVLGLPPTGNVRMLELTAMLALGGRVRVLDGGNCFDAYAVARHIRRYTAALSEALNNIQVARAFTCYQVLSLFEAAPASETPHLVFDLLATFHDESVSTEESFRLLSLVVGHLKRLGNRAPVVVGLHPRKRVQPDRKGLVQVLLNAADEVLMPEQARKHGPAQMALFGEED